ncbi:MAG: hypothetical protein IPK39_09780 [Sulfuritalea sp.]|nr:hypothetical protein [Sulfuritalea sp.]
MARPSKTPSSGESNFAVSPAPSLFPATGFDEPDELGELGEAHIGANLAFWCEERFWREGAELEAAAESCDHVFLGAGVSLGDPSHALCGDVGGDLLVHFDEDETALAAVLGVLLQYRMAAGAASCKAIENQGVLSVAICRMRWRRRRFGSIERTIPPPSNSFISAVGFGVMPKSS